MPRGKQALSPFWSVGCNALIGVSVWRGAQAFMVAAVLTVLSLLAAICFLFPVVAEYERKQKEEDALGSTKREDNPAVENYKQNYLRGGDYRRGGAGEF